MDRSWWSQSAEYKQLSMRRAFRRAWNRTFPRVPLMLRVFPGLWWLAQDDAVSDQLFAGFELRERQFLNRILTPGMTVLDIGAHAGLYTILASKRVGPSGRVLSFEPSARERRRLKRHVSLNCCRNVSVIDFAIGEHEGQADLFIVEGRETGCNSLRRARGFAGHSVRVRVRCLDDCYHEGMFSSVDVIKMDVQGAEELVLRGAWDIVRSARPIVIFEV